MTPAQRQYDLDLAASMQRMSKWIEPRSRKVADVLRIGALRLQALIQDQPPPPDDMRNGDLPKQPASTPARKAKRKRAR